MTNPVLVQAAYDSESHIWYVHQSTLQGLHVEGETFEALVSEIKLGVESLLEGQATDVSINIIAHTHEQITLKKAA